MCEYCLDEWYKRNSYELIGTNDYDAKIKLSLDSEEGLLIEGEWTELEKNEPIKMGFVAEAVIRYCPWCGRKLKNV